MHRQAFSTTPKSTHAYPELLIVLRPARTCLYSPEDDNMDSLSVMERYRELQQYMGGADGHAERVRAAAPKLMPFLPGLIDGFYAELESPPQPNRVNIDDRQQLARLKASLVLWLEGLLRGEYDSELMMRRVRVGQRHLEVGLDQVYTNAALSRLRAGLIRVLAGVWQGTIEDLMATVESLNLLFDLDLALIQKAWEAEELRLRRTERFATISQISGGIAHELRNPLNAVKVSVYYLLHAKNLTPEKLGEHLGRIDRQADKADAVIKALSAFTRIHPPALEPFDIAGTIQESVNAVCIPDDVIVEFDVDPGMKALGDTEQIQIVLGNLVRNAVDAMPAGGRLTIIADRDDDQVNIQVRDTGIGIQPHDLSLIMEPLFTTKAHGIGLGLATASEIVQQHDGSIAVESEPDRGCTFTIQLKSADFPLTASGRPERVGSSIF